MSAGDWFSVVIFASVSTGLVLFCIKEARGTDSARTKAIVIPIVLAIAAVVWVFPIVSHRDTVATRNAIAQVRQDHPNYTIRELSTKNDTIKYIVTEYTLKDVASGKAPARQICTADLFHFNGRWLVVTEGARCAQLPPN